MEEEVNENELEEQFYSMLHYVDQTQVNVSTGQDALALVENALQSTVRRYWRTSEDNATIQRENRQKENTMLQKVNSPYQKVNTPKETPNAINNDKSKPKEEKRETQEPLPVHLSFFQSAVPQNMKNTIEIIEHDVTDNIVELDTSDEDEVIEVALPPKPTITIESSDEDEHQINKSPLKHNIKPSVKDKSTNNDRERSTSPVPSVVSSISDDFIRSDCIALNISSHCPDNHSFDFSLHGADLLGQSTPSKKKKKKKNREATSTPIEVTPNKSANIVAEECFATPKSKAKNKKQKTKSYSVTEKSIPNADVYDSDSNQSMVINPFAVSNVNLPSADVCETHSIPPEVNKSKPTKPNGNDVSHVVDKQQEQVPKNLKRNSTGQTETITIVDLTDNTPSNENTDIQENIMMGNVTGFPESDDYGDNEPQTDVTKYCSTRVPAILYENLDFDNLKGKNKVCKNRRYSLTSLRAEMDKFYNESWGGEEFNHHEIQRNMSSDKRLWAIDPKDRMPTSMNRKKTICNYCNRPGHRDDSCYKKPLVCYMCGSGGHAEPRCPGKICVNCGAPNYMYSTMCRNCSSWGRLACAACGQPGHPASHCPDVWRRYHNTIEFTNRLEENRSTKKYTEMFCSGCTRRGHLAHDCRHSLPFSGLQINSPYVQTYAPIYPKHLQSLFSQQCARGVAFPQDSTVSPRTAQFGSDRNKRLSTSPTVHDNHINKKRIAPAGELQQNAKSPVVAAPQRNVSECKDPPKEAAHETGNTNIASETASIEKAPDFIPIAVNNHDKRGQMIQDNEVSDTSDVVTSAKIYVTDEVMEKLKTKEGEEWLKGTTEKHDVIVENTDAQMFLSIKGRFVDQEAFQAALRDWTKSKVNKELAKSDNEANVTIESDNDQSLASHDIPRNRFTVLRKINKALDSLKEDLGEPNALYEEVTALRNHHAQLLKQKVINPKHLSKSRDNINGSLKKLNMLLLGQSGLADGSRHLNKLYSLQEKLISYRQKNITNDMRKEIGEHFHTIFTAAPRNDYGELLENYYRSKKFATLKKKKKNKRLSPKKLKKLPNPVETQQNKLPEKEVNIDNVVKTQHEQITKPFVEMTKGVLLSCYKRLGKSQPSSFILKNKKVELMRRANLLIAALIQNNNAKKRTMRKIRQVQDETQTFLNNV